jgi:DNA-directed RNA polymerase II subunit RPB2
MSKVTKKSKNYGKTLVLPKNCDKVKVSSTKNYNGKTKVYDDIVKEFKREETGGDVVPEESIDDKMCYLSDSFMNQYPMTSIQIGSYNCAIEETIPTIIAEKGYISIENEGETHTVVVSDLHYEKPMYKKNNDDIEKLYPKTATDLSLTYPASMYVNFTYTGPDQKNVYQKVHLADIPVMVGSSLCNLTEILYDKQQLADLKEDVIEKGGYFIIKGATKAIIAQVRASHNAIHTYKGKTNTTNGKPKFTLYAEVLSGDITSHITTTQVGLCVKTDLIGVVIPYIDASSIPLGVVFRALGVTSEIEMASYVFPSEWFSNPPTPKHAEAILLFIKSLEQSFQCDSQDTALNFIGKKGKKFNSNLKMEDDDDEDIEAAKISDTISYAKHLLSVEFLPHIGPGDKLFYEKAVYIGYMTQKLLLSKVGIIVVSDRDHPANKIIQTTGMILASHFLRLFKLVLKKMANSMTADIKKGRTINISSYISSPSIITTSMISAFTSNKWTAKGQVQGISQAYDNFNIVAGLAFLRKFLIPIANEGSKIELPRHLHTGSWFGPCPYDTPEGKKVGFMLAFSAGTIMTIGCDPYPIMKLLSYMNVISMYDIEDQNDFLRYTRVFVNGKPQGYTDSPQEIVNQLRIYRRTRAIQSEVGIVHDESSSEINILTNPGRLSRACAIVENGKLKLTSKILDQLHCETYGDEQISGWMKLLENGYVEIIGKDEEEFLKIAVYPTDLDKMSIEERLMYTHCELSPDMMQGIAVSSSPKNNHNQSPRNIYHAGMTKQAIGVPGMNYEYHTKGKWHALVYPQKPIVSTRIARQSGCDEAPMGQNVLVAISPFGGYNQEDSLVLNQDSIDRGLFCAWSFVSHEAVIKNINMPGVTRYQSFEIPISTECNKFCGNSSKLQEFDDPEYPGYKWCYVPEGTKVEKNDMLIGLTITYNGQDNGLNKSTHPKKKTNISIYYTHKWSSTVYAVYYGYNGEGYMFIKVITRQYRRPVEGDKFCYTADHEVLTTEGWVGISDITTEHEVASLKDGKYLVYENPIEVVDFKLDKNEELIHVDTNQVDLCVTANHNMYVKTRSGKEYGLMEAQNLFDKHVHYKKDAVWDCPGLEYFKLPGIVYQKSKHVEVEYPKRYLPINDWCMFYGLWIAEGWTRENHSVGISVDKLRVKLPLIQSLENMDIKYTIEEKNNKIHSYDRQLMYYMENFEETGALNKTLGDWVWKLNEEQCRIVLEGMLLGDGHTNGKTPMYDTSSVQLKDDVMRLVLHCGWAANAVVRYPKGREHMIKGRMTTQNADSWRLTIIKTQLNPAVNKHIKEQQKWVTKGKNTKVFCCTMPSGLLYVRRSSQKPVWCGNSARHGQKGTAGKILPGCELPFLKKAGCTPDVWLNPLAFPSRMTIGMLIEIIMGKALCSSALECVDIPEFNEPLYLDNVDPEYEKKYTTVDGEKYKYPKGFDYKKDYNYGLTGDGTPFVRSFNKKPFMEALKKMGHNEFGEDTFMNPETGEEMTQTVFTGICFYQALKHIVVDKHHARAYGPNNAQSRQPTEGRKKKGGLRVGYMEKDKIGINTPIALPEGISVKIKHFKSHTEKIWGWDSEIEGLVVTDQLAYKQVDNHIEHTLYLQDGRQIKGSENHPFLTLDQYMKMKDLVGERVMCSINPPLVDLRKAERECNEWIWTDKFFAGIHCDREKPDSYEKMRRCLCLARLLGLVITDGRVKKDGAVCVYPDHLLDVETVNNDIFRLTGTKSRVTTKEMTKHVLTLPPKLAQKIQAMDLIGGRRVYKPCYLPEFMNENTPKSILREFLGSMFGGDGHTVCLGKHREKHDLLKSVSFSWVRCEEFREELRDTMNQLGKLLKVFGIEYSVQKPKKTTWAAKKGIENYECVMNIPIDNLVKFSTKIGFRYCENKAMKLAAGVSYRMFREGVLRQRQWICDRVNELTDYKKKKEKNPGCIIQMAKYIDQATKELIKIEPRLHKESVPTNKMIGRMIISKSNNKIRSTTFPHAGQYFQEIGVYHMFVTKEDKITFAVEYDNMVIPGFHLKVLDIRKTGRSDMCDIKVTEEIESFVASGIIAHNCMLSQGIPEMVQDRMLYNSDVYRMPVCQICGLPAIDNGKIKHCNLCNTDEVVNIQIPFGMKLLAQEFMGMNIVPRTLTLPMNSGK